TGPINPQGQASFFALLEPRGPGGASYRTFAGVPGDLKLVHQPAPFEGAIVGVPAMNSGPRAVLWPQGADYVIYWDGVAESQVPTPGQFFQPTINASGRIAFTVY